MSCGNVTSILKNHPIESKENVLEDISTNYVGAGVGVKQVLLNAGMQIMQHKHKYAHLSILVYGHVTVETDEYQIELEGSNCIVIPANTNHLVTVHADSLWLCVHNTENLSDVVA